MSTNGNGRLCYEKQRVAHNVKKRLSLDVTQAHRDLIAGGALDVGVSISDYLIRAVRLERTLVQHLESVPGSTVAIRRPDGTFAEIVII